MSELDDILKGWVPEFGNDSHIRVLKDLRIFNLMKARPFHTKASKERMDRLEKNIIWTVEQSRKPK